MPRALPRAPGDVHTVKNLYPNVETVPARKPAARAPKGVSIISPAVPTTTPPASAAFWMWTWGSTREGGMGGPSGWHAQPGPPRPAQPHLLPLESLCRLTPNPPAGPRSPLARTLHIWFPGLC